MAEKLITPLIRAPRYKAPSEPAGEQDKPDRKAAPKANEKVDTHPKLLRPGEDPNTLQ